MLQKRTIRLFRRANMANQQSGPPNNIIKQMKAGAAWKQKESKPLGHCAVCDPKEACGQETTGNALPTQ